LKVVHPLLNLLQFERAGGDHVRRIPRIRKPGVGGWVGESWWLVVVVAAAVLVVVVAVVLLVGAGG
jgi:hypothetical protein